VRAAPNADNLVGVCWALERKRYGGGGLWDRMGRDKHRVLGEGEKAVGMHQTQDMIRKERPDGQGAEDA